MKGNYYNPYQPGIIATNGKIHEQLFKVVNGGNVIWCTILMWDLVNPNFKYECWRNETAYQAVCHYNRTFIIFLYKNDIIEIIVATINITRNK